MVKLAQRLVSLGGDKENEEERLLIQEHARD